jgi:hypothetical protein
MRALTHARPVASFVGVAAGIVGSIACSVAMVLAVLGSVTAGVAGAGASMAGMAGSGRSAQRTAANGPLAGLMTFLTQHGPAILIVSTLAMTLAVLLRRPLAAIPVLVGGVLLYWGMYLQPRLPTMYASIVVGLAAWLTISAWVMLPRPTRRSRLDAN